MFIVFVLVHSINKHFGFLQYLLLQFAQNSTKNKEQRHQRVAVMAEAGDKFVVAPLFGYNDSPNDDNNDNSNINSSVLREVVDISNNVTISNMTPKTQAEYLQVIADESKRKTKSKSKGQYARSKIRRSNGGSAKKQLSSKLRIIQGTCESRRVASRLYLPL